MPLDDQFLLDMRDCAACGLRDSCSQVVLPAGNVEDPALLIVGEAPGADEDQQGEPFVGDCGLILRQVLRSTKSINRLTTCITNVVNCRPPRNKFPKDETPQVCRSKWLYPIIERLAPQRMLLLGNVPLKYVAGTTGITKLRGQWIEARGIRTLATFHPSYILRKDRAGDIDGRRLWESDIMEMAKEVARLASDKLEMIDQD